MNKVVNASSKYEATWPFESSKIDFIIGGAVCLDSMSTQLTVLTKTFPIESDSDKYVQPRRIKEKKKEKASWNF